MRCFPLTQFLPRQAGQRFTWPVATCALIALNLMAWFAVASVYHVSPFSPQHSFLLLKVGAINGELLGAGQWWRLITSQFLHVHFPHLVFNVGSLLLLGILLESELGFWRFIVLYLGSGVVGQIIGVAATPALVSSGASQATMGLAGGAAVGLLRQPHARTARLIILLIVVAVQVILDVAAAGYIKAGHLGGFCAGAVIWYALRRKRDINSRNERR